MLRSTVHEDMNRCWIISFPLYTSDNASQSLRNQQHTRIPHVYAKISLYMSIESAIKSAKIAPDSMIFMCEDSWGVTKVFNRNSSIYIVWIYSRIMSLRIHSVWRSISYFLHPHVVSTNDQIWPPYEHKLVNIYKGVVTYVMQNIGLLAGAEPSHIITHQW